MYQDKYYKYKKKYLELKQSGGINAMELCKKFSLKRGEMIPQAIPFDCSYKNECNFAGFKLEGYISAIITSIEKSNSYDIIVLKIGSNDSTSQGAKNIEAYKKKFLYSNDKTEIFIGLGNQEQDKKNVLKISMNLGRLLVDESKILLISVDPEKPTAFPLIHNNDNFPLSNIFRAFLENIEKLDINLISGCFPLARGSEVANLIIDKFVNLNKPLIIINAMGSECYNSLKEISDRRKSITHYFALVDILENANCYQNIKIYDNLNDKCNIELSSTVNNIADLAGKKCISK